MSDQVRMTLEEVRDTAVAVLRAQGFSDAHAGAIAESVTAAERDECKSHGLFRIPFYVKALESGKVVPDAEPAVQQLAPGVVQVDARNGFGNLALVMGADLLEECARYNGIAALSVINAYNVAALWPEVERLGSRGLVAFAWTAAMPYVAPAGGTKPLFGTNPMAFAWPRPDHPPLVFDQASSVSARGEIQLHLRDGSPLPEGWALGPDGQPTTDPQAALEGAQLTFGGYKGAAIALMVELLAGALLGQVFSYEAAALDTNSSGVPYGGEFMIAIDPARCVADGDNRAQLDHAEQLFAKILEQEGTRLPSQRRYEARQRTPAEGVAIPAALHEQLQAWMKGSATSAP